MPTAAELYRDGKVPPPPFQDITALLPRPSFASATQTAIHTKTTKSKLHQFYATIRATRDYQRMVIEAWDSAIEKGLTPGSAEWLAEMGPYWPEVLYQLIGLAYDSIREGAAILKQMNLPYPWTTTE